MEIDLCYCSCLHRECIFLQRCKLSTLQTCMECVVNDVINERERCWLCTSDLVLHKNLHQYLPSKIIIQHICYEFLILIKLICSCVNSSIYNDKIRKVYNKQVSLQLNLSL